MGRKARPVLKWTVAGALICFAAAASAQEQPPANTMIERLLTGAGDAVGPNQVLTTLILFFLLTILSLAPAILVMTTSFTRIIVVLGFLRQAMATQQSPPNQVLVGLALFLTIFIMGPTYQRVYDEAIAPYVAQEISAQEALDAALIPIREFMFRQVRERDVALFLTIAGRDQPDTEDDIPTTVLMPAFVVSELRVAFQIGFVIYIPFLIIDMVVASTLMAMGMMMLPPVFVSLPFKIVMFVLADGWYLVVQMLAAGFQ